MSAWKRMMPKGMSTAAGCAMMSALSGAFPESAISARGKLLEPWRGSVKINLHHAVFR